MNHCKGDRFSVYINDPKEAMEIRKLATSGHFGNTSEMFRHALSWYSEQKFQEQMAARDHSHIVLDSEFGKIINAIEHLAQTVNEALEHAEVRRRIEINFIEA